MGSLSNLYISQSYQSLIHFGNDSTASTSLVELQDGLGNNLGISINTNGDLRLEGALTAQNLTVTGAVDIDTYFTSSTPPYTNLTQPYFTDTVYVTGSYPLGAFPPSIADVQVGWLCNGINVTNGLVTAVSQSGNEYWITIGGQFPQSLQPYTFTGGVSAPVQIRGDLEISENLIVSGTFDIEGKVVVNDNVRINGNLEVSGSQRNTGSLFVSNAISSSTITGIGNVSAYSSSVWAEFTNIENYTSSLRAAFTASGVNTIFTNDITASNIEVRNNLNVVGTITANKIVTLIESASVIYSSGSNILGDEITDTQTLIGSVIVSGSGALTGSLGISNNLSVGGNISSSTISGIGNVTSYSQSVDARLDIVEATASLFVPFSQSVDARLDVVEATASLYIPFSTSVDSRLDFLEGPFSQSVDARLDVVEATASLYIPFSTSVDSRLDFLEGPFSTSVDNRLDVVEATASLYIPFSTSVDLRLDQLESFSSSFVNTFVNTASFNAYTASTNSDLAAIRQTTASLNTFTQSTNIRLTNLESTSASVNVSITNLNSTTASLNSFTQSITSTFNSYTQSTNTRLNTLSSFTGSYATTGSNFFIGNQTFSGSVEGSVIALTISAQTASMDLLSANFFTITLASGSNTHISAFNATDGQTISLKITQPTGAFGTVTFSPNVKFPLAFPYIATPSGSAVDIISFQTYDPSFIYGVAVNTMR